MKRVILALALFWPLVVPGQSFLSGNKLMGVCDGTYLGEPRAKLSDWTNCTDYLAGIMGAIKTLQSWGETKPRMCIKGTGNINVEQLRQVFLKYMRQHPEDWHLMAGSLALNAYLEAWPCKE